MMRQTLNTRITRVLSGMEHVLIMAEMAHQLRVVAWPVGGGRDRLRASLIAGTCAGPAPGSRLALEEGAAAMPLADRCQYAASRARSSAANAIGLRAPASQSTVTTLASAAV